MSYRMLIVHLNFFRYVPIVKKNIVWFNEISTLTLLGFILQHDQHKKFMRKYSWSVNLYTVGSIAAKHMLMALSDHVALRPRN